MPRAVLPFRRSACVAIGLIALGSACGDGETLTDVAPPAAAPPRVTAPNLAAGGNKPTSGLGYEVMTSTSDIATDTQGVLEVYCSAGKRAIGGGFFIDGGVPINGPDVYVYESSHRVTGGTDGWRLAAMNRTGGTRQFNVYAICAAI